MFENNFLHAENISAIVRGIQSRCGANGWSPQKPQPLDPSVPLERTAQVQGNLSEYLGSFFVSRDHVHHGDFLSLAAVRRSPSKPTGDGQVDAASGRLSHDSPQIVFGGPRRRLNAVYSVNDGSRLSIRASVLLIGYLQEALDYDDSS
ncbi:hypothetical protein MTO96_050655 [Rhipicephalus appendiculatus]